MSFLRLSCVHSHGLNSLPEEYGIFSFTPPEKALEGFKVLRIVKNFLKASDDQTIKALLAGKMLAMMKWKVASDLPDKTDFLRTEDYH